MPSLSTPAQALAARPWRGRLAAGAGLVLAVLLLHALLLMACLPGARPAQGVATAPQGMTVRLLSPAAGSLTAARVEAAHPATAQQPAVGASPLPRRDTAKPQAASHEAPPPDAPQYTADASDATGPSAERAASVALGEQAVPVYATRLPGPARLQFQLKRGELLGIGQLSWQRQGPAYVLSLEGELQGKPVLGSVSRGSIDADGVAPLRLADQRRLREVRAANFQRDTQRISFSGPQVEYPLHAGVQDRLSWMIQLPAIIEAEPSLAQPGARVTLFVVGTRGDAQAWDFEVQGHQTLQLPAGEVARALHLRREAQRPYDTRVEVWLDPQRQHLPVRAVLTSVPYGQPLEFNLSSFEQPGG